MTDRGSHSRIRVLVLAPYPTMRAGLRAVVESDPAFAVAGEQESLDGLANQVERLAPDVILLDPGGDVDRVLEELAALLGGRLLSPVVMIAPAIDSVTEALENGVQGFLLPDVSAEEIRAALHSAVVGLTVIDRRAIALLLELRMLPQTPPASDGQYDPLTPRELEVLQLIAQGLPNKTIALALGISEHTVKFHVGSVLTKLEASSRAEALARAARVGLIVL